MNDTLTKKDIESFAAVARLRLTENEREDVRNNTERQLHAFGILNSIDTNGVPPMFDVFGGAAFKVEKK